MIERQPDAPLPAASPTDRPSFMVNQTPGRRHHRDAADCKRRTRANSDENDSPRRRLVHLWTVQCFAADDAIGGQSPLSNFQERYGPS